MHHPNCNESQLLNDAALAQLFRDVLGLRYSLLRDRFEARFPGEVAVTAISTPKLLAVMANTLAQHPGRLSPAQLQPRWFKKLLFRLKTLCACPDGELDGLDQFVATRLVRHPGSDVTSAEVCAAYQAFVRVKGCLPMSPYTFHRQLPAVIKDQFGIAKRHEILRPDASGRLTKRNGWRGIRLNDEKDATDTTDGSSQNASIVEPEGNL